MPDMHVEFKVFFWADHSKPVGLLIHDIRAQACWCYVLYGHRNLALADAGATYEGELDTPILLGNIVRAVSTMYAIQDPAEMLKFMDMCRKEARRCHFDWDARIEKPDPKRMSRGAEVKPAN